MKDEPLILPHLFCWAHRQGENFCTEVFAGLIRAGLRRQPGAMKTILEKLFLVDASKLDLTSEPRIIMQATQSTRRRPDFEIKGSSFLFFVEAKTGADEGERQLEDYAQVLARRSEGPHKSLLYLTDPFMPRRDLSLDGIESLKFNHLRWRDTVDAFEPLAEADTVFRFLRHEYEGMIRKAGLMLNAVGKSLAEPEQRNALGYLIRAALSHCRGVIRVKSYLKSRGLPGSYATLSAPDPRTRVWVGFTAKEPHKLWIQPHCPNPFVPAAGEAARRIARAMADRAPMHRSDWGSLPCIDLKSGSFFELKADAQVRELNGWLQRAIDAGFSVNAEAVEQA